MRSMIRLYTQYIVDAKGRRHAVQLPFNEFRRLKVHGTLR